MKNILLIKKTDQLLKLINKTQLDTELFHSVYDFTDAYQERYETVDKLIIVDSVLKKEDNAFNLLSEVKETLATKKLKYKKLFFLVTDSNTKGDLLQVIEHLFPSTKEGTTELLHTFTSAVTLIDLYSVLTDKQLDKVEIQNTYEVLIKTFRDSDTSGIFELLSKGNEATANSSNLFTRDYTELLNYNSVRQLLSRTPGKLIETPLTQDGNQLPQQIIETIPDVNFKKKDSLEDIEYVLVSGLPMSGKTTMLQYLLQSQITNKPTNTVAIFDVTEFSSLNGISLPNDTNYLNINDIMVDPKVMEEHLLQMDKSNVSVVTGSPDLTQEFMRLSEAAYKNTNFYPDKIFILSDIQNTKVLDMSRVSRAIICTPPNKKHLGRTLTQMKTNLIGIRNTHIYVVPCGINPEQTGIHGLPEQDLPNFIEKQLTGMDYSTSGVVIEITNSLNIPEPTETDISAGLYLLGMTESEDNE